MRNGGGDNSVGFDAYPSGGRSNYDGEFFYEGLSARWFAKDSEFLMVWDFLKDPMKS
jgi:hypothetical protein